MLIRSSSPASDRREPQPGQARLWAFRLLAAGGLPLALLVLVEIGLRLAGLGDPTGFLLAAPGRSAVVTNQKFGWRFFPPAIARTPQVFEIVRPKPAGVFRIAVLGSSAALGTPEPGFGLARRLEMLLEERYPQRRFEVWNAAMTAINSHVALPIARELARERPDLLLLYLGNNEVVGPFGGGTVFGGTSPRLSLLRAGLVLRSLRVGQLLDRLAAKTASTEAPRGWRGMEMFAGRELRHDDPRLEVVYRHFRRNLEDVVAVARRAGAQTLISTVAVNLADNPPFASLHRPDLSAAELAAFDVASEQAHAAESRGELTAARDLLEKAAAIDGNHAEVRYRLGQVQQALGETAAARASFERARDGDALRFRADSVVNHTIREVAAEQGTLFFDAERALDDGFFTDDFFYEHVHFNSAGNQALALGMLEKIEPLLGKPTAPLPSPERCAERLAETPVDLVESLAEIERMTSRPPFTRQLGHAERQAARRRELAAHRRALTPAVWEAAETTYRRALERRPEDLELRARFARLLHRRGKLDAAESEWRRLIERHGEIAAWHSALALVLADRGATAAARAELERVEAIWPGLAGTRANLGSIFEKEGRVAEAEREYRRALTLDPEHTIAGFNLATLRFRRGELAAAEAEYRALLERDGDFAPAVHNLGGVLEARGRLAEAAELYARAVSLDPGFAAAWSSLGLLRAREGRPADALAALRAAVAADPANALARFNLADLLLEHGRAAEAAGHYRAGLELRPDNPQARKNLTLAERLAAAPASR